MDIVLASASPRRRELLTTAGLSFRVLTADTDETVPPGTHPERAVSLLSERKAAAVRKSIHSVTILSLSPQTPWYTITE